jgi:hypothetical protein
MNWSNKAGFFLLCVLILDMREATAIFQHQKVTPFRDVRVSMRMQHDLRMSVRESTCRVRLLAYEIPGPFSIVLKSAHASRVRENPRFSLSLSRALAM